MEKLFKYPNHPPALGNDTQTFMQINAVLSSAAADSAHQAFCDAPFLAECRPDKFPAPAGCWIDGLSCVFF